MMDMKEQAFNFRTQQFETPDWGDPSQYIPQDEAAQLVYQMNVELGQTPLQAALRVLRLCNGEEV